MTKYFIGLSKSLISFLIMFSLLYMLFGFSSADMNYKNWDGGNRMGFITINIIGGVLIRSYYIFNYDD